MSQRCRLPQQESERNMNEICVCLPISKIENNLKFLHFAKHKLKITKAFRRLEGFLGCTIKYKLPMPKSSQFNEK